MAEQGTGVYRSRIDSPDWEPDEDVGGWAHMLFDLGAHKAGLWRADPLELRPAPPVEIPSRETILVLAGSVRVTIDGGMPHDLAVGDLLSIPERSMVGWDPSSDCLVFWTYG
jgi:uncharacterized cupin superfamily protein